MAPSLFNRRAKVAQAAEEKALELATSAVAKAFMDSSSAKMPGTSWSNQGGTSSALIARVTRELASSFGKAPEALEASMAAQGLSWGPPFPPGRPLDPFWGYRRPPRTWDFPVGVNTQVTPRWGRISFATLKSLIEAYDVAQICIRHLINDVRSLNYRFEPLPGMREDVSDDLRKAREFFASPDKRQPFRAWVAEYLQDVLRYDAGSLYIRRNEANEPIALEVVSGATIMPLVDFYGRPATDETDNDPDLTALGTFHGEITPAYAQVIEGLIWDWMAADDLLYQPWNPQPDSQYGLAPMEAVLLTANTDLRFQWHFLQYFTEGTLPAGFMEAPPDMSDPAQLAEWQAAWDAIMLGDQAKLRQIRWVPHDAKFHPAKPFSETFDEHFPLYLMRRVAASFGVTPNDLGFTESVNRATGDTQIDVQFRVGTLPLVRHIEDIVNLFIQEFLKLPVQLAFDTGQETQDRLVTARADAIYVEKGVISPDEIRRKLGYPVSRTRPVPRFIDNSRAGPIPLLSLESLAGETDYETYSPAHGVPLVDHQFASLPGVAPVVGSPEYKAAQATTAEMQAQLLDSNAGPGSERDGDRPGPGRKKTPSKQRSTDPAPKPLATPTKGPKPKPVKSKPLKKEFRTIAADLLKDISGNNTGGPGITASTGIQGVDLESDESKNMEDEVTKVLDQWQENTLNRLRKGMAPKEFETGALDPATKVGIFTELSGAGSPDRVREVFAGWRVRIGRTETPASLGTSLD